MKNYPFPFSTKIKLFCAAGIFLAAAGLFVTVYRMLTVGFTSAYTVIQYVVLLIVCTLLIVIIVSLLIKSYYKIDKKTIISRFGIVKSSFKTADVESLTVHNGKLYVQFKDNKTMNIGIDEQYYDDFFAAVKAENASITFEQITDPPQPKE